jgi:hypothetical protein
MNAYDTGTRGRKENYSSIKRDEIARTSETGNKDTLLRHLST